MKYLITESQLDNIIFKYLDNQDFIQIESGYDMIYFVNSEGDKYGQIKYDKDNNRCYIYYKLIDEISSFFSMELSDSEQVIAKWVENTLQMKVTYTWRFPSPTFFMVENTLQMKVTYTSVRNTQWGDQLKIPSK